MSKPVGVLLAAAVLTAPPGSRAEPPSRAPIATFSIAAADPDSGEVGVAVASRFFAVGSVVPWVRAGAGAVATQSYANVSYGPRGLDLLAGGVSAVATLEALIKSDDGKDRRQVGLVSASGDSVTFTGAGCLDWAGGRRGPGYAIQGNILTGEQVVVAMAKDYLETKGDLATRLFAALAAGDGAGGDARGRQSAALRVSRAEGGYGGFDDRYIDIRVDDHEDPFGELGRLLGIARVNGLWNLAWTRFTREQFEEALPHMEATATMATVERSAVLAEVLYDLAVIRAAAGKPAEALVALGRAIEVNPKLKAGARADGDLGSIRELPGFAELVAEDP